MASDPPKVLISYSHDSPEHAQHVLALANRLREDGVDCIIDQYVVAPEEGWPRWMHKQIRDSDFVLMICTETHSRRVMGEEEPGKGHGADWERHLIEQYLYDAGTRNTKFIPVVFKDGDQQWIPPVLQSATFYDLSNKAGYENLYRRLINQPRTIKPELGKLRSLPSAERKSEGAVGREDRAHPFVTDYSADYSDFALLPDIENPTNDWLDIRNDVNAFGSLIAACNVAPPLSIGLFGEWGSGKSFFMRQLRHKIDKITHDARASNRMQKDIAFYKRIVQIEFNAWHYVEGNLWASLVDHIFENLRAPEEKSKSETETLQTHLLGQLKIEKAAEQEASRKAEKARQDLGQTNKDLEAARSHLADETAELAKLTATDVLATIELPETVRKAINRTRAQLGLTKVEGEAKDLIGALAEARALLQRGSTLLTPLVCPPDRRWRFAWLLLVLIAPSALGLAAGAALELANHGKLAGISAACAALATFLGGGAAWIRTQAAWISPLLREAEEAQQRIDERVAAKQAELNGKIRKLETQLETRQAEFLAAQQKKDEAQRRVAQAENELAQATSGRLLSRFIQDRAESNDYRKHLGLLALVRQDFERLSALIEEANNRYRAPTKENEKFNPFTTLAEEETDKETRLNRIVLYIDDLDRCPPEKVVEVLQAVHLLLAFPLFVVVVGVDARWISRSLETYYGKLLGERTDLRRWRRAGAGIEGPFTFDGRATPRDYLEKIFQIPFWLEALQENGRARMLHGLFGRNVAPSEQSLPPGVNGGGGGGPPPDAAGHQDAPEQPRVSGESTAASRGDSTRTLTDLNPRALEITLQEQKFIESLVPLLDTSPRGLKRFANIYRLIKAGLPEEEQSAFTQNQDKEAGDYQIVLFLLTIATSFPSISPLLFQRLFELNGVGNNATAALPDLRELIKTLSSAAPTQQFANDWQRLDRWLVNAGPGQETTRLSAELHRLAKGAKLVSRFSFRLEHG
jgi:SEFIR domain/KAP family P-loop domain